MYYEIRGYNKQEVVNTYVEVAYDRSEKEYYIKQFKNYLKEGVLDMFKVTAHYDDNAVKYTKIFI